MKMNNKVVSIPARKQADGLRLGSLIREKRMAKRLTQEQLASQFGINKNAIGAWEQGRNSPKVEDIPTLCKALDISLFEFFGIDPPYEDTPEARALLNKIQELNPYNFNLIDKLADTMIEAQEEEHRRAIVQSIRCILRNEEKAAAGLGNPLGDNIHGSHIYLYGNALIWQADEVITVTGDSMEPTYYDGDELLVEHTESISSGQIGIFVADGEGLVKEYQPDGLHSHNPKYPVRHFTDDDNVRCVGRVLGKLERKQYASPGDIAIYKDSKRKSRI